jgi:hypothetical protein
MLDIYLETHNFKGNYDYLVLRCDNCGSQNKNKHMVQFMAYLLRKYDLKTVQLSTLIVGHTKFSPDRFFGTFSNADRHNNSYSMRDLQVVADSIEGVKGHVLQVAF